MEDKESIYRRQSAQAAKNIASWPKWMQDNLTPPRQVIIKKAARPNRSK